MVNGTSELHIWYRTHILGGRSEVTKICLVLSKLHVHRRTDHVTWTQLRYLQAIPWGLCQMHCENVTFSATTMFFRYNYHFPFLKTNGIITVDDNCVDPLYKHVFPPSHAPSLAFIGIPWKVYFHKLFFFLSNFYLRCYLFLVYSSP